MKDNKKPEFSVIVLFDRGEFEPCLSSIMAQKDVSFEIIAVVNPKSVGPVSDRINYLEVEEKNPAFRRNRAVKQSKGDYLAFIDDDAYADSEWLKQAKEILINHPEYAGIGGINIAWENQSLKEWISDVILSTPLIGSGNPTYRKGCKPRTACPGELHLSNFFVRKNAFLKIGGFNEKLGYGAEDSEFIREGNLLGLKFGFFPSLEVKHKRRAFGWNYLKQRFNFRRQNGKLLFIDPFFYQFNPALILGITSIFFVILFLIFKPFLIILFLGIYYALTIALCFKRAKEKPCFIPLLPFCFFLHHLVYASGLIAGFLEGLIIGRKKLKERILR